MTPNFYAVMRYGSLVLSCLIWTGSAMADSASHLLQSAAAALRDGQFEQAIEQYGKVRDMLPERAEIPYNLGIAHYRNGDFAKAAEAFKQAISLSQDDTLRARSIYNMGNAAYAQTLKSLQEQQDGTQPQEQLKQATDLLKDALQSYKKAVYSNPRDEDARANAEISHQFLRKLQELQEQMQQQPQQQQQQQEGTDQSDQEQQNQQSSSEQHASNSADSQQQSQQQQQQQQQQQPQQRDESDANDQSPQNSPSQEANDPTKSPQIEPTDEPSPPKDQGDHVQHDLKENEKKVMNRQEAEQLLQLIRDKERKRRAELARREAVKHISADKDW